LKTILSDQGLLNHLLEQIIIRRATFDATARTTSSGYQSARPLVENKPTSRDSMPSAYLNNLVQGNFGQSGKYQDNSQIGENEMLPNGTIKK
jgi:hypothetical protein